MDIRDTRKVYAPARQDLRCYPDSPELQGLWLTIVTPLLWSHNMFQPRDRAGTTMACGYRWVIQSGGPRIVIETETEQRRDQTV